MNDLIPDPAPRPTGAQAAFDLTGKLMPWIVRDGGGLFALLMFPLDDRLYLPVWDHAGDLAAEMDRAGVPFNTIKQITEGFEFLASLRANHPDLPNLRVMVNCRTLPNGRQRFHEINPFHLIVESSP